MKLNLVPPRGGAWITKIPLPKLKPSDIRISGAGKIQD